MINIYGSNQNKSLPVEQMIKFIEFINSNLTCNIILNYMPSQKNEARILISKLNQDVKRNIVNYVPNTLKTIFILLIFVMQLEMKVGQ